MLPPKFIQRKPRGFHCTDGGTEAERESGKGTRKEVLTAHIDVSAESQDGAATAALSFLQLKGNWAVPQHLVLLQHSWATTMSRVTPARDLGSSYRDAGLGQPLWRELACPQAVLQPG